MTEPAELIAAKRAVRAGVRRSRADRPPSERRRDDLARRALLRDWLGSRRPACVAGYLSAGDEPDTWAVIDELAGRGVEVLLPVSAGGGWTQPGWTPYGGAGQVVGGPRGITEPTGPAEPAGAISRAEVVLCPGVAGTLAGDRLGRGGGWYDRVLPLARGPVLLLLNDDEVRTSLPTGALDQRVDLIITPTRVIECSPGRGSAR